MKRYIHVSMVMLIIFTLTIIGEAQASIIQTEDVKLLANDGTTNARFGESVALDGNTAVVGAFGAQHNGVYGGAAYVFTNSGENWLQQAKLVANDGANGDGLGMGVAVYGNIIAVGSPLDDDRGDASGSVYIFTYDGTIWTQMAKLTASDGTVNSWFGERVALGDGTLIVGARGHNGMKGTVYVFVFDGVSWVQQAKLTANDGAAGDQFGSGLALTGDTAVIGAYLDDDNGLQSGSAYVFTRTGITWTQQAKLLPIGGAEFDYFGWSVAAAGNTVLVGAYGHDLGSVVGAYGDNTGAAYSFTWDGTNWSEEAEFISSNNTPNDSFGIAVSLGGETAVIGAFGHNISAGSAYVFSRTATGWDEQTELVASDGAQHDHLGHAIAVDGLTALISANVDDDQGIASGSAYIFSLVPPNQPPTAYAGDTYMGDEGSLIPLNNAMAVDPDGDLLTYYWSVDSTLCVFSDSAILQPEIYCVDNGVFSVTLTVNDGQNVVSSQATVTVNNVAPTIEAITGPTYPLSINDQPIHLVTTFSDPGTADTHEMEWDWGDGTSTTQANVTSPVPATHTYGEPGVYVVIITVTDDDTGMDMATYDFIVVYNPDGGHVTGGGWIDSEVGWCQFNADCANASGRAHFGFVSKYKNGATIPTGNTQFNFTAGSLHFQANSFDWLVIDQGGTNAQYKGSGMINGQVAPTGELYKFMIWAKDSDPVYGDKFRIKIWYEDGDEVVVYDNGSDQPIGSGNIKIHDGN